MSRAIPETTKDERGNLYFKYHTFRFNEDLQRETERLRYMGYKTLARVTLNTNTLYTSPKAEY